MKLKYLDFLKQVKGKNYITHNKQYNKRHYSSSYINNKKNKTSNYVSYPMPTQNERNHRYNFEVLMKIIKNRADEYNLIKIKEAQNKILLHLPNFTINEVISTLILSFKYNLLNSKLLHEITEHLFHNSSFLNTNHLYILVLIAKKIQPPNFDFSQKKHVEEVKKAKDISYRSNDVETHEEFVNGINENIRWQKKFYNEIKENIFLNPTKMEDNDYDHLDCPPNEGTSDDYIIKKTNETQKAEDIEIYKNETNYNILGDIESISFDTEESQIQMCRVYEDTLSDNVKNIYLKIREILHNNYNNIYLNIKNNMHNNLLLLNYLYEEGIISKSDFIKIVYNINTELSTNTNDNIWYDDACNDKYQDHCEDIDKTYSEHILIEYIKEQTEKASTCDLYIQIHLNLLKDMLKKNHFINKIFLLEKLENNITIKEEEYIYKNMYTNIFSSFFFNLKNLQNDINWLKLFYLNIIAYEIFKIFTGNNVPNDIQVNFSFLKNIKCADILQEGKHKDINYEFLAVIYYLKKNNLLNYTVNIFEHNLYDIKYIYGKYSQFLNLLNNFNLFDILMSDDSCKEAKTPYIHNITHSSINTDKIMRGLESIHNISKKNQAQKNNDVLINDFFSFFMVEFTFNIISNLNKINLCEQIFILKYIQLLNFKNEYLSDLISENLYNFFIRKQYNSDINYLFYFLEYMHILLIYSPHVFFNIINNIYLPAFQNLLNADLNKYIFIKNAKSIYNHLNTIISQNEIELQKLKKPNGASIYEKNYSNSYNKKTIKEFQNILYDFLFL
ncbi:conserved Plasmodium protein, unknown function [Plasmodium vinckei lentum]|uniref:Uncharacterized protein n=1 Tax=Plasmodium vinckei lentum TaxID=138297 RepID=A0A6V7SB09_PLAVN|nr:conserved Plasmodium protein, unknown function [Plasmodium vinckei lentum]